MPIHIMKTICSTLTRQFYSKLSTAVRVIHLVLYTLFKTIKLRNDLGHGKEEIIQLLIEHGANVRVHNVYILY